MSASNYYIGANDEHGLNPPTLGKRTPVLPYLNRQFYENEINRKAKQAFILDCIRCGFNVYDIKPELTDTSVSTRVARVNSRRLTLLVTFAYNAYGDGRSFNNVSGHIVFYMRKGYYPTRSRLLAYDISAGLAQTLDARNLGVGTLDGVGVLESVRCPSVLCECGFMTNLAEAKLMYDPDYASKIGEGACRGVCEFLAVPYIERQGAYPTVRRFSRGKWVLYLQYALSFLGYDTGSKDGVFGSKTETAVKEFQSANSITADGIVGRNTWTAINRSYDIFPTLRRTSRGELVEYLQNKLTSKLYDTGAVDGIFGAKTESAVRQFQEENSLAVDGIVGRNTWSLIRKIGGGRE
ncbi:MAG: peptidoglycan-binding protein [Clostridia bacterium]|nr:peptidoglycan-binding protein [Clostridia bacterium]